MKIGGLREVTLMDYPNHIAATVFTRGCNLSCPFCHNSELIKSEGYTISEKKIIDFLTKRKRLLEGVVITGGEPTVQEDIGSFLKRIKKLDYKIKLDSNGTKPLVIKKLIDRDLVDYLAMDIKTSPQKYKKACGVGVDFENIRKSINIIKGMNNYEFRITAVPGLVDENDISEISKLLQGAKKLYIQQFRSKETLVPSYSDKKPFTEETLERFKNIAEQFIEECQIRNI